MKISKNILFDRLKSVYSEKEAELLNWQYKDVLENDLYNDVIYVLGLFNNLYKKNKNFAKTFSAYRRLALTQNFYSNETLLGTLRDDLSHNNRLIINTIRELEKTKKKNITNLAQLQQFETQIYSYKELFRYISAKVASLITGSDWKSPAYACSAFGNIYYPSDTNTATCNYKRYGYTTLYKLEERYQKEILGIKNTSIKSLLTASGMSSYALIEDFITKDIAKPNDLIMTSPYIYFEAYEQLAKNKNFRLAKCSSYDYKVIVDEIIKHKPCAIFLDPITNTGEMHLIDLENLIREIDNLNLSKPLYLIIDTTLTADMFNPFEHTNLRNKKFKIVMYESFNKYRQLGLDMLMMGSITAQKEDIQMLEKSRRNTGQVVYDYFVNLFPEYTKETSSKRFRKLSQNAEIISRMLTNDPMVSNSIDIYYPGLTNHPDYAIAKKYQYCGGLVAFLFKNKELNSPKNFSKFIDILMEKCRKNQIPLNKGVSFGFDISRISSAASMAATIDPFLRLSVGTDYIHNILLLAKQIKNIFCEEYSLSSLDKKTDNNSYREFL
ncbi:MAG: PLP-dependent transferase [bacterium]|nr:PLP-dependent transferase [bacterium]